MRSNILDAAMRAFTQHGYASAPMDSVAAEAGISKGSIYNYFPSKKDLFIQILHRLSNHDEQELQDLVVRSGSVREKVEQMLDNWNRRLPAYEEVGRLFLEFWAVAARDEREGPIKQHLNHLRERWEKVIAGLIREGSREGSFLPNLDPDIAAALIVSAYDGLSLRSILHLTEEDVPTLAAALKRAILRSLGCQLEGDAPKETSTHGR
ncbi:MAG: TetR/AcrR family transcriptional regulator [Phycisphaerae bacterium]